MGYEGFIILYQLIYWIIIFFTVFLFLKCLQCDFRESYHFKALEDAGATLQIISMFLMLAMFYSPFLAHFPFPISILLICIGFVLYYQTKSELSVSFILWGITMQLLILLLTFPGSGTWEIV